MSLQDRDVRCTGCNALLGKREGGGLSVRRGGIQICVGGNWVTIVCYRCGKQNCPSVQREPEQKPSGPSG